MRQRTRNAGQTFLEFLLLMLIMVGLSLAMIRGFNTALADRWKALVEVISLPSSDSVDF